MIRRSRLRSSSKRNLVLYEPNSDPNAPTTPVKMEEVTHEENENVAEVVLSNKGGPKVIHNGYMYTLHKKQPNNIRWRCVGRTLHCRGSLLTTIDCKKPRVRMEHNHNPDFFAAQLARKRYLALGQPPVLADDESRARISHGWNLNQNDLVALADWDAQNRSQNQSAECQPLPLSPVDDKSNLPMTRPPSRNSSDIPRETQWQSSSQQAMEMSPNVFPTPTQTSSGIKALRIGQSLIRPRTIAPAPQPPQQSQQQHQQQQSQPQQQQQQQPPKTLVLKTIPLKVKHVAPTTIKMPPRQIPIGTPQVVIPQQPTEVCLRWNSYHSNMQNSFPSLLDSEQFVDVTLACEGRSLKCHKMILSSCSDYLANLLRENPCQHPIILMKDLKFWEVEALVKFMYRGEVNVAHDKLPQLLNAAEALQVKGLAGPNPSSQNPKPPMLIPQSKPSTSQPTTTRVPTDTAESRTQAPNNTTSTASTTSTTNTASTTSTTTNSMTSPKRSQKRRTSETNEAKPFTKIRLQRPPPSSSPIVTVKSEPLDIPLSPTQMFSDGTDQNSSISQYENQDDFHGEEDPGGNRDVNNSDSGLNFCVIPDPPDLNDNDEQMEFVPTDFLEQEQDILGEQDDMEHDPDHDGDEMDDADECDDEIDGDESPDQSRGDELETNDATDTKNLKDKNLNST